MLELPVQTPEQILPAYIIATLLAAASNSSEKLAIVAQTIIPPFLPSFDIRKPPICPPDNYIVEMEYFRFYNEVNTY